MPEGHSVHRIARQFARNFVGQQLRAASPQGRFQQGAAQLDGRTLQQALAVGKQMFLDFGDGVWLRVHLGMYGAWDFAGDVSVDATIASANGRSLSERSESRRVFDADGENSLSSIGAPRKARLVHMGETESTRSLSERSESKRDEVAFPPEPVGQVRLRLLSETVCADLRGPTACEVLNPMEVDAQIAKLGPDPLNDASPEAEARFVEAVRKRRSPIGLLLMDQSVVSGIGNVYRAELLFRARLNPHVPGSELSVAQAKALWRDWVHLLEIGVTTGQMMTMDDLNEAEWRAAMANRADRHWVYKREGLSCRVCGTHVALELMATRKLYWCPKCQKAPRRRKQAVK